MEQNYQTPGGPARPQQYQAQPQQQYQRPQQQYQGPQQQYQGQPQNPNQQQLYHYQPSHMKNGAENSITFVAYTILILGIIATVYMFATVVFIDVPVNGYGYSWEFPYATRKEFNPGGLFATLLVLFTTIMQWAFMKVIANISLNLKDINKKLK
ncbi:MAG: hypothetical protein IIW75_05895 [Bacteroidaceae bacterium]|nr:hypothetical protein [Bacteroidaceae bacterium]